LTPEDIYQAITLVQEVLKSGSAALGAHGTSNLNTKTEKIINHIRFAGEVTKGELMRTHWKDITKPELDMIIDSITTMGIAEMVFAGPKSFLRWKGKKGIKDEASGDEW
jgi:hypothetical protein